ncbi:MAG: polyphosphate polymerase domain-containing protein [Clostridiales bacterium]|nr:polyphosphate polymerase domain-containing protein [Clostridiales bacterium]
MGTQMIFRRYELKYLLTQEQKQAVQEAMEPHMALDRYGRTTIRNLYFDTDSFLLVRHSIEHPAYKEKLRVRSYREASPELPVYVELKKKYDSVVYKRRLALPEEQAVDWLAGLNAPPVCTQIAREVEYFRQYYRTLAPRVYLSYEREAYYDRNGGDFRVTFDENILSRTDDLTLEAPPLGPDPVGAGADPDGDQGLRGHPPVDDPCAHRSTHLQDVLFQIRHRLPEFPSSMCPGRQTICLSLSFRGCSTASPPLSSR